MPKQVTIQPLSASKFAPFGDVLDAKSAADMVINQGMCDRHHDRAKVAFNGGRAGVSVFNAAARSLPYTLELMERHPLGSQCFMPMTEHPFLVIVADDDGGIPAPPLAFLVPPHTGVNIHLNIWHGVLTPLYAPGLFAVIDCVGVEGNLEEHRLDAPYIITS